MHVTKEATTSSKIEGTQTSFAEALIPASDSIDPEKRDDWQEVNNYIAAMNHAIAELGHLPITERLIKQVHSTLLQGVRGQHKSPGTYRTSQNWIGPNLKNAIYVPPIHTEIQSLMTDLEHLLNADASDGTVTLPHLIRAAIIHYQFETIHPFLDGNGRIGRLLIPLYLIEQQVLKQPTLYLSDYFERHRRDYYDHLTAVRKRSDLKGWVLFFLQGVIETAQRSIQTFRDIIALRHDLTANVLPTLGRRQADARLLTDHMYKHPILDGAAIAEAIDRHASSTNRLIQTLVEADVLSEMTGYRRNRIYAFRRYIEIFE
jgi:Fic family protein